jgi:hypothetical protein
VSAFALPRPSVRAASRALTGLLALAATFSLTVTPSRAAPADGTLAQQVKAMQATADRVGTELAAGAQAWEAGRARLDALLQQQFAAERQLQSNNEGAQVAQARLNALARRAYTHPTPESWALAMSVDPQALTRSLENLMVLRRIGATRRGAVEQLVQQRVDSSVRAEQADRLRQQAQAAQARLQKLRAQAAARLAAARHQSLGRVTGTCSATADGSYANGFLPPEMLCPLATASGQQLAAQAAAAFDRLSQLHKQTVGTFLCVTDSYRSYPEQVAVFASKPTLAATPGRSQHGWGLAVDLCGGVERFGTAEFAWMSENAPAFGFEHPAWAEPGGSKPEPWHWEFNG